MRGDDKKWYFMLIYANFGTYYANYGSPPPHKYNSKKSPTTINKVHAALIAREYPITSNLY